ncbi:MAG: hypothetical protein ABSB96_00770 [Gaiellaceae bacterium]
MTGLYSYRLLFSQDQALAKGEEKRHAIERALRLARRDLGWRRLRADRAVGLV